MFHPRVEDSIRRLTFDFCQATNETSTGLLSTALQKLREQILEGLAEGEALKKLSGRVEQIFRDPMRAVRIARTESSRAVHSGQYLCAKESGVVKGKKWVAKSDACPMCLSLQNNVVGLDEDFAYDSGRGSYAHVPYPPRHPHCTCSWSEVLMDQYLPRAA